MRNKPQYSRLLFIDKKIRGGKYPNCGSLAEEYEVSLKTIYRDIEYMRDELDAPVEYSAKHRGFYYTEERYQLPAMDVRESDIFGIYLAEKLLIQYEGTPIYGSLCRIFQKIQNSLPDKSRVSPAQDQEKLTIFPPWCTVVDPEIWETVIQCLRESSTMRITYRTPGKDAQERLVDPYHGISSEGDWYVIGFCHFAKEIRTFSISRISSAINTGQAFQVPESFDFQKLFAGHFGIHIGEGDMTVRIQFKKEVAPYIQERKWHPNQQLQELDNGDVILSLTVNHRLELQRWILSWGDKATILEPESFALETRQLLERTIKNYER
ncbi:MAG: hypothetical protein BWK76_27115 [Desulfobulbaceae bacterium A2]|nr:MAG: hypothetical protein BWK76_27115 [Desulfobulbaceae bacterium A2]